MGTETWALLSKRPLLPIWKHGWPSEGARERGDVYSRVSIPPKDGLLSHLYCDHHSPVYFSFLGTITAQERHTKIGT